jgi:hypothetical protein
MANLTSVYVYSIFKHMPLDPLVQTRIPRHIARWLASRAKAEGTTVAGWLRQLIIKEHDMQRVAAWIRPLNKCDPMVADSYAADPNIYLDRLEQLPNGETIYALVSADRGIPVGWEGWQLSDLYRAPDAHRVLLRGNPRPMRLVTASFNETAKRVEITLAVDKSY